MAPPTKSSHKVGNYIDCPRKRMLNNKVVILVKYFGSTAGHSNYYVGMIDGRLICDERGVPKKFHQIGELVNVESKQ